MFYPTPPANDTTVEFTLEEIVRTTNVLQDMPGNTAIQFHLADLADLVRDTIDILIRDLQMKRQINVRRMQ